MINKITFRNFKVLADAELPLERFTLLVGPNGSGKSTVFQALQFLGQSGLPDEVWSVGAVIEQTRIRVEVQWGGRDDGKRTVQDWLKGQNTTAQTRGTSDAADHNRFLEMLGQMQVYSLDANAIKGGYPLRPVAQLPSNGSYLAVVLDRIRDQHPERFEELNDAIPLWFPDFDRVLFDTPQQGHRSLLLRTKEGKHPIKAEHLSQGTLLGLALLTLAYLPDPPPIIGLEEPDRGLHPRLLRDVRDALYRLSYPEASGENRSPVQVIATTHSPYFLDLYKDHPEEIVIAHKEDGKAYFKRLVDLPHYEEILEGSSLGEVWYSGILGGVPATSWKLRFIVNLNGMRYLLGL